MTWVAVVATVVSVGANYYNQQQTAHKQDRELQNQLAAQHQKQMQADERTRALLTHEKSITGNNDAAKQSALASFTNAIQANKANSTGALQTQGAVSDAYKKAGSDAALGIGQSGANFADLVSSIDAPMQTRKNDQRNLDDYGIDIDQIKRFNAGDDFLSNMRLRAIKPNPWVGALSQAAGAYGQSRAGSSAGAGYGSATPDEYSIY